MSQIGDFMVLLSPSGSLARLVLAFHLRNRRNASLLAAGKPSRFTRCWLAAFHTAKYATPSGSLCGLRFGAAGGMLSAKEVRNSGERFDGRLAIRRR
jgi:hypothetical protein